MADNRAVISSVTPSVKYCWPAGPRLAKGNTTSFFGSRVVLALWAPANCPIRSHPLARRPTTTRASPSGCRFRAVGDRRAAASRLSSDSASPGAATRARPIARAVQQLDQAPHRRLVERRQLSQSLRPACRPHRVPGRLVSIDEELGPLARASAHAFPLLIEPALELWHLRHMEAVEQAAAIQRQRLLRLSCLERRLELSDIA